MSDPNRAPIDVLIDRERIRGASRMIPVGTDASAVTADQIQAVRDDVLLFKRAHRDIDVKSIANAVGVGHSTASEFLKGTYRGNNGQLALDMQNWLIEEEERRKRPATTQFVWSNIALQIQSVANYCLDYRKIGLVYGPDTSGIGKTTAMQAIHQELGPRRSSLVTLEEVDSNPTALLKKLLGGLHVQPRGTNKQRYEQLVGELKGRSHLLLIDQIHYLRDAKKDKPLYILCDLWDATKSAQLWCGTADIVAYLNRQRVRSHDESLAQIRRRIFPRVDLMEMLTSGGADGRGQPLATLSQIREMFAANKLKLTDSAARFLFSIINRPDTGGVGLCVQLVEYATMLAEMQGIKSIDTPLIKQAMRHGITTERADHLVTDIEESENNRSRKVG